MSAVKLFHKASDAAENYICRGFTTFLIATADFAFVDQEPHESYAVERLGVAQRGKKRGQFNVWLMLRQPPGALFANAKRVTPPAFEELELSGVVSHRSG